MADLQFASALDARGNPVIRVTSSRPIDQPLLTFLIEVDWGQGRLVREYTALIDAPRTAAAPMQPSIQAPQAAPSNTIIRRSPGACAGGGRSLPGRDRCGRRAGCDIRPRAAGGRAGSAGRA